MSYYAAADRPTVMRLVDACERDGSPYDFELPKLTAKGRRIWVRSIGQAVRDSTGRITRIQGAFQDVTDRRQAEEAGRASEAQFIADLKDAHDAARTAERAQRDLAAQLETERGRLVAAQAVAHVGSWETDLATMAVLWSAETYRIFETSPARFCQTHAGFLELIHPEDRAAVDRAFIQSVSTGMSASIDHRLLMTDGRIKFVVERWHLVRAEHGRPARAIGTCQDITDRHQLEQQYLRAQRMESIGTLAGGIAHDLNNVLAPILLSIGLLQEHETDLEQLRTLATIESSAKRGAAMVSRVLSFARGMEGSRVEVEAIALIRELATIVRDTFPKNIAFVEHVEPDLWTLQVDPTQLHQVLLNLCVNARDAMPSGGVITITVTNVVSDAAFAEKNIDARIGPYVSIEVADTGTGIPMKIIDKIFDPFFTTKSIGKGTGLGLATSMAIVKGHEGFMRVESDPGNTRFQVFLPAQSVRQAPAPLPGLSVRPRGNGETVLIVDDESSIREVARRTLEKFGFRTLQASDGAEGLALYARHQQEIAVVVTDMMMPVMDGAEMIQQLVRLNPDVRIVYTSGLAAADVLTEAGARFTCFLAKPYTADTLLSALHSALSNPHHSPPQ